MDASRICQLAVRTEYLTLSSYLERIGRVDDARYPAHLHIRRETLPHGLSPVRARKVQALQDEKYRLEEFTVRKDPIANNSKASGRFVQEEDDQRHVERSEAQTSKVRNKDARLGTEARG